MEGLFIHLNAHFGVAHRVGENLRVVGRGVWPGEAEREARACGRGASVGDPDLHRQRASGMHGPGVNSLLVKFLHCGQRFRRFPLVEDGIELAIADGVNHFAM